MPILYVHGVAIREDAQELVSLGPPVADWPQIGALLREFVAPELASDPENVTIERLYWGDLGANMAWKGRSRPTPPPRTGVLERIEHLSKELPLLSMLRGSVESFLDVFIGDFLSYFVHRGTSEHPGPVQKRALEAVSRLHARGQERSNPAQASGLQGGEPLIVVSHSMGGQIVYDLLSYFLPLHPEFSGVRVDFWVNAGSQIGLFEEMKVFAASSAEYSQESGLKVPKPLGLGYWWDVWDYGDPLSYTVAEIFEGVDTEPFRAGTPLLYDHIAYVGNPAFYTCLAVKLRHARALHWFRHLEPDALPEDAPPETAPLENSPSSSL